MKYLNILNIIGLCSFLIFGACKETKMEKPSLKDEVMEIHDTSMAEMGRLRNLVYQLDSMKTAVNADTIKIKQVIEELEKADEGMMEWMANYKEPSDEKLDSFLEAQKIIIQKVSDDIYSSIEKAEALINEK